MYISLSTILCHTIWSRFCNICSIITRTTVKHGVIYCDTFMILVSSVYILPVVGHDHACEQRCVLHMESYGNCEWLTDSVSCTTARLMNVNAEWSNNNQAWCVQSLLGILHLKNAKWKLSKNGQIYIIKLGLDQLLGFNSDAVGYI